MKHELRLTDIGEGLEEAEIVSWLVAVGDQVQRDQPIVEVMTDKSNAELPAPSAGTVVSLGEAIGSIIHVGDLLAVIEASTATSESDSDSDSAGASPAATDPEEVPADVPSTAPAVPQTVAVQDVAAPARPKASPSTRRAAAERGIDLRGVVGSGPGGRILLADLDGTVAEPVPVSPGAPAPPATAASPVTPVGPFTAAAAPVVAAPAPPPPPPPPGAVPAEPAAPVHHQPESAPPAMVGVEPLRGVRRAIARNMAQSWSQIPHIHAFEHIDAEPLLALRARMRGTDEPAYASLTPLSFFVAAVARALTAFPQANASIDMDAGTITTHGEVNIGVAVAAPQGLVVPVLHNVGNLDFKTLSRSLNHLIAGAREGTLAADQYQRGTATISNFGSLGGEQATPLIRPPESLIMGFGSIDARPFVIEDQVVARKTMHLVIGADHRLLDGDVTTAVLNHVADSLRDPLGLVL